jgi:hypothetical protein
MEDWRGVRCAHLPPPPRIRLRTRELTMDQGVGTLRRVVTTHDVDGNAVIMRDDQTPTKVVREQTGIVAHWVWTTASAPASIDGTEDASTTMRGLSPPPTGSIFRVVDFPPTPVGSLSHETISASLGLSADHGKRRPPRHPLMHATESVDYAIILHGNIEMMLDKEVVFLKAGDVVVQQATNHAWINRGPGICRIAFVLLGSKPL